MCLWTLFDQDTDLVYSFVIVIDLVYSFVIVIDLVYSFVIVIDLVYSFVIVIDLVYSFVIVIDLVYSFVIVIDLVYSFVIVIDLVYAFVIVIALVHSFVIVIDLVYIYSFFVIVIDLVYSFVIVIVLVYSFVIVIDMVYSFVIVIDLVNSFVIVIHLVYSFVIVIDLVYSFVIVIDLVYSFVIVIDLVYSFGIVIVLVYSFGIVIDLVYGFRIVIDLVYSFVIVIDLVYSFGIVIDLVYSFVIVIDLVYSFTALDCDWTCLASFVIVIDLVYSFVIVIDLVYSFVIVIDLVYSFVIVIDLVYSFVIVIDLVYSFVIVIDLVYTCGIVIDLVYSFVIIKSLSKVHSSIKAYGRQEYQKLVQGTPLPSRHMGAKSVRVNVNYCIERFYVYCLLYADQKLVKVHSSIKAYGAKSIKSLSKVHSSIKAYGRQECESECELLHEETTALKQDLKKELDALMAEEKAAEEDLRSAWPSAVALRTGGGLDRASIDSSTSRYSCDSEDVGIPDVLAVLLCFSGMQKSWQRDAAELAGAIARCPLASEDVKMRVSEVFVALQETFLQRYDTWREDFEAAGGGAAATGGWKPEEHSQFCRLRERFYRDAISGPGRKAATRDAVLKRMVPLLPGHSLQDLIRHDDWYSSHEMLDLIRHDDWYSSHKMLVARRREIVEGWARERKQFLDDTALLLDESAKQNAERAEQAAIRLVHELTREHLHSELKGMIDAKQAEWEAGAQERAEKARKEEEQAAADVAVRQEEQSMRKVMIADYRHDLEAKAVEQAAAAAAAAREAAAIHSETAEYNRERLDWRKAEYIVKVERTKEQQRVHEEEERARQQRLDHLRALVAPQVEADPNRVFAPTEASSGMNEEEREAAEGKAFKDVHGYTVEKLYRDPKFKLIDALTRNGLQNTDYGRKVIDMARTAKPTRRDNLTTQQMGSLRPF
eukprot:gene24153-9743_t